MDPTDIWDYITDETTDADIIMMCQQANVPPEGYLETIATWGRYDLQRHYDTRFPRTTDAQPMLGCGHVFQTYGPNTSSRHEHASCVTYCARCQLRQALFFDLPANDPPPQRGFYPTSYLEPGRENDLVDLVGDAKMALSRIFEIVTLIRVIEIADRRRHRGRRWWRYNPEHLCDSDGRRYLQYWEPHTGHWLDFNPDTVKNTDSQPLRFALAEWQDHENAWDMDNDQVSEWHLQLKLSEEIERLWMAGKFSEAEELQNEIFEVGSSSPDPADLFDFETRVRIYMLEHDYDFANPAAYDYARKAVVNIETEMNIARVRAPGNSGLYGHWQFRTSYDRRLAALDFGLNADMGLANVRRPSATQVVNAVGLSTEIDLVWMPHVTQPSQADHQRLATGPQEGSPMTWREHITYVIKYGDDEDCQDLANSYYGVERGTSGSYVDNTHPTLAEWRTLPRVGGLRLTK